MEINHLQIVSVIIAVLVFGILSLTAKSYQPKRLMLYAIEEFSFRFKKHKGLVMDYEKTKWFLCRMGADFHFGTWMEPMKYLAIKVILSSIGLLIGIYYGIFHGLVIAVICYLLPGGMLVHLNKQDNERLLPELKLVYHALALQIKAGVYVTDALTECYGSVQEERLRKALLELSGDIVMNSDVGDAMETFQRKFDNRYIDSLCITILQALESGQAVELLSDIAEQIKDMEGAVMSRKKSALDRSITFYQLGILSVILAIVLYACITHMFLAAVTF